MPRTLTQFLQLSILIFGSLSAQIAFSGILSLYSLYSSQGSSIESSKSSTKHVAQGPYEVTAVAVATDKPDALRLTLHALEADAEELYLTVPRQVVEQNQIAVRSVLEAAAREYGVAFAVRDTSGSARTFFLVLEGEWHRELDSRLVTL